MNRKLVSLLVLVVLLLQLGLPHLSQISPVGAVPVVISPTEDQGSSADAAHKKLVRSSVGALYVVYTKNLAGKQQIYLKHSVDNGTTWISDTLLSTYAGMGGYDQDFCAIAIDSHDYLHVVWHGCATGYTVKSQIWYTEFTTVWSAPIRISSLADMAINFQDFPSIAVDSLNNLHVVWAGRATGYAFTYQFWYAEYTSSWSTPILLSTVAGMDCTSGDITVDSHNYVHVAFNAKSTVYTAAQIWYTVYTTGPAWSAPIVISTLAGMNTRVQGIPSMCVDSHDYLHIIWYGRDATYPVNFQTWYTNFTTVWSTPLRLSTFTNADTDWNRDCTIAVDSGDFLHVLIWSDVGGEKIWYTEYMAPSWTAPIAVQSTGSNYYPNLRWSRYPTSNHVTTTLDYVFINGAGSPYDEDFDTFAPPIAATLNVGDPWKFVGRTNYAFILTITSGFNTSYIISAIRFDDAANRHYSVSYDGLTKAFSLVSPSDGISGSIRSITQTGAHTIVIIYNIMFNPDVSDTLNIQPEYRVSGGALESDTGWVSTSSVYFNIYNIGGIANVTSSGWAGLLYDNTTLQTYGDAFEIFAADSRTPWLIDLQGFDQNPPVGATYGLSFDPFNLLATKTTRSSPDSKEVALSDPILFSWVDDYYFSTRYHKQNVTNYLADFIRDMWITGHLTYSTDGAGQDYAYTDSSHLAYHSPPNSLRFKDTNVTEASVLYLEKAFRRPIRAGVDQENVTLNLWVMAPYKDPVASTGGHLYLTDNARRQGDSWLVQKSWAGVRFAFNASKVHLQLQFENSIRTNAYVMNITAGDWYNVTVNVDLANYKVQYIVDGVIISNSTGSGWTSTPTTTATSMGYFAVETTNSVSIRNDFYLDDIQVFTNWNRNYGGMAKTQAIFYRLQEWHQDFDLNIEQGKKYLPTYANKYAYKSDAWAAMGWDIQIAGEWVNNALWCNITVVDSKIDGTNNWVKYNATWYQNVNGANVTIRSDQIVGLYEGYSGMNEESGLKDLTSFHWDIWFNRMNASTVMGGRLNTAYFGVSDKAPWYAFWYNDYKATAADLSSSSVFRRVLYANGTAASVKEVVLVRPWEMIWRSNKEQYHWAIKNIDEQAFRVTSANMEGIDTPAPKKTQMPTVPQSGVGAWLAAAFKGIMAGFGDALTFGAMNVWTSFVGFLDIIAGFFGAPGFFTTLFAQVSTFTGYMITSFLMLTQLVVQMFIFLVYIIPYFMWTVVRWITYILQILAIVKGILDGTGTAVVSLGNLWAMFNMEIIITFIIVLSPIMWMSKLDEESQKGNDWVAVAVEDIQRLMNIFSMLIQFFVSIINLAITVLFAIIESIPVVE